MQELIFWPVFVAILLALVIVLIWCLQAIRQRSQRWKRSITEAAGGPYPIQLPVIVVPNDPGQVPFVIEQELDLYLCGGSRGRCFLAETQLYDSGGVCHGVRRFQLTGQSLADACGYDQAKHSDVSRFLDELLSYSPDLERWEYSAICKLVLSPPKPYIFGDLRIVVANRFEKDPDCSAGSIRRLDGSDNFPTLVEEINRIPYE